MIIQRLTIAIISQWNVTWPFIWTNLYSLYPRMFQAKFGWIGGTGEDENASLTLYNARWWSTSHLLQFLI